MAELPEKRMNRIVAPPSLSFTGCLLAADPRWDDPLFKQSVCLVVHHGSQGAVGVMLNRTLPIDAQALLKQFGAKDGGVGQNASRPQLFLGGIQSGPVVAMHQRKDLAEYTSAEGVYFAAHVDTLKQLVRDSNTPCRIFIGQAVWAQGQLEQQFTQGCWLPLEVNSRVAFETPDRMWVAALRQAGNCLVQAMLGTGSPGNAELN